MTLDRRTACGSDNSGADDLRAHAIELSERCIELGTSLAGELEVVKACRALRDTQLERADPLSELIPEPRSSSTMIRVGVVGPEL